MRRRWVLGGVPVLAVGMVAAAVLAAPHERLAGSPVAEAPQRVAAAALGVLADLDDIELTGWVRTGTAQRLHVDIVVTGDGAQAVVEDEAGGVATIVAAGDDAAIRANAAWWLNTVPAHQQAHSDRWVRADDSVGFPVSALSGLTGDAIREMIARPAARATWTATSSVFGDGTPARTLTLGDTGWRVYVTPAEPPALLGIGGPLLADTHRVRGGDDGRDYPDVELGVARPGTSCRQQTGATVARTAPTIPDLPAPSVPDMAQRPRLTGGVRGSGGICRTPMCPFTVEVTNVGGGAGVGTLVITSSSGAPMTVPLNLPPGGRFSTVYNAPNPAPPSPGGRVTVPISVQAFAQITSLAGPDVAAGRRLNDRGVDPNNPVPGRPGLIGPGVTGIMDRLTSGAPTAGVLRQGDVVAEAEAVIGAAADAGLLALLHQLVSAPALRHGDDPVRTPLLDLFRQAVRGKPLEQDLALRTLKLLAALTEGRKAPSPETAPVHVEADGVIVDDTTRRAHVLRGIGGGAKGQKGHDALYDLVDQARRDFDRDGVVPSGYARVVDVTVRGDESNTLGAMSRTQLVEVLRDRTPKGGSFRDVLLDDQGDPAIQQLSITSVTSGLPNRGAVNGAFVFDVHDIAALGQTLERVPQTPPTTVVPHFTPATAEHMWHGDAVDPHRGGGGGHRYGAGVADKTEYPKTWSREVTEERVIEVASRAMRNKREGNPHDGDDTTATGTSVRRVTGDNKNQMGVEVGSWEVRGSSNGIELVVHVLQDGTIASAYPTGNVADDSGVLQPYEMIMDPANPTLPYRNPPLPKAPPRAQLPEMGREAQRAGGLKLRNPSARYVRAGTDGRPEWRYTAEARPGNTPVPVEVVADNDGKHKKTTRTTPPKRADPPPAVCQPTG
ncbi:hypothetical protein [Actinophytocola sp. NPDC049390]|uniref:hypothetical protein n=1 Tax=Actinophytocola sp. NPDC049390 TaxID=3363894 RepID=UPI0037AEA092